MNIQISRRDVLLGGGALIVSFSLAGPIGEALAQGAAQSRSRSPRSTPSSRSTRGMVTVYSGKVDLGTGIRRRCGRSSPRNSTCRSAVSS